MVTNLATKDDLVSPRDMPQLQKNQAIVSGIGYQSRSSKQPAHAPPLPAPEVVPSFGSPGVLLFAAMKRLREIQPAKSEEKVRNTAVSHPSFLPACQVFSLSS